jgi:hypothetical protein
MGMTALVAFWKGGCWWSSISWGPDDTRVTSICRRRVNSLSKVTLTKILAAAEPPTAMSAITVSRPEPERQLLAQNAGSSRLAAPDPSPAFEDLSDRPKADTADRLSGPRLWVCALLSAQVSRPPYVVDAGDIETFPSRFIRTGPKASRCGAADPAHGTSRFRPRRATLI